MIVLAESNFVLELAFKQEQSDEVENIVALAKAGRIELVIPACAFTEPYQTLTRRLRERGQLTKAIKQSFGQLGRSRDLRELVAAADEVTKRRIVDRLERYGCKLITDFSQARRIVEHGLRVEGATRELSMQT